MPGTPPLLPLFAPLPLSDVRVYSPDPAHTSTWRGDTHFFRSGSQKSVIKFITSATRKLWDVTWDMWEHQNAALREKPPK